MQTWLAKQSTYLRVDSLSFAIAGLPAHLQGCRLVHLSDFHYDGVRLADEVLTDAVLATNAAAADLILLTGDYVTDEPEVIWNLVPWLKRLRCKAGVFAVLGNHDLYRRRSRQVVSQALAEAGVTVLWNQVAYPLGEQLALVGLADFWSSEFDPVPVFQQVGADVPRLVLSHNPDSAEVLQSWRIDLQLSGHTHGGQVVIPGLGPIGQYGDQLQKLLPRPWHCLIPYLHDSHEVIRNWKWSEGLHQVGHNFLYVNRGLGTYWPGRLFCPPEVTVITLQTALSKQPILEQDYAALAPLTH